MHGAGGLPRRRPGRTVRPNRIQQVRLMAGRYGKSRKEGRVNW